MAGPSWLARWRALFGFTMIRSLSELIGQMLNVAIGWHVYAATHDPMSLAYVGLVQFVPDVTLLLFAGQAADRFDRRRLIGLALLLEALCLAAFAAWAFTGSSSLVPVYALLLGLGVANAFLSPAMSALQPHTVDAEGFPRAVAITTSAFQMCSVVGPALGGLLYAMNGPLLFAIVAALSALSLLQVTLLPTHTPPAPAVTAADEAGILAGLRYIRSNRLLLGLISLDLFAVLLGGVSALMPIYARDILATGPEGLGWLRCAPAAGAALVGLALARHPVDGKAGRLMLACVAGFGAATLVFAVSANLWLSLVALAVAGGFDMVSMVIRQTMTQLSTPDAMRGRVSAVSWLFIGASAQLGDVESGVAATLLGPVGAAILGGVGTLVVVGLWAWLFPELRDTRR
jgi:MFS family permease